MGPQQGDGNVSDGRTDNFAFGAVLYEMATGQRAFKSQSQAGLITAILSLEPPPISTLRPGTPPELDHVVKRCLNKDVERRWQTARDVMFELQWIAEGGSQDGIVAEATPRSRKKWER